MPGYWGPMSSSSQPSPGPWPAVNAPIIDWARAWCARGNRPEPLKPKEGVCKEPDAAESRIRDMVMPAHVGDT
jgi:hypothetical protein